MINTVAFAAQICIESTMCLEGTTADTTTTFTVHSKNSGWAAIGLGTEMRNSQMVIGYKNQTGGVTIGSYNGTGNFMPSLMKDQELAKIVFLKTHGGKPEWAELSFSFEMENIPDGKRL
jgi:hypothetical protein